MLNKKYMRMIIIFSFSLLIMPALHADTWRNIYTPNGTLVGDSKKLDEMHYTWREYYDDYYAAAYPNAIQIKLWWDDYSSSRRYNCHGYAWHMIGDNAINDPVWIGYNNPGNTWKYWQDESYTAVGEKFATMVDYSGDHSAVTTSQTNYYISKWNKYPLVRHHKNYTPGYGTPVGFYKRTPAPSIYISGPYYLNVNQSGTFTANTNGNPGTYGFYKWWYRNDGDELKGTKAPPVGIWFHNSYWDNKKTITAGFGFNFSLKCKAFNNGSNTATDIHSVSVGYPPQAKYSDNENTMELQAQIPNEFVLYPNYPNPFNPITSIKFGLPETGRAIISVYSITGQKVKTLFNGQLSAGYHQLQWDGTDQNGSKVTSGVYLYHISATSNNSDKVYSQKRKMILMK